MVHKSVGIVPMVEDTMSMLWASDVAGSKLQGLGSAKKVRRGWDQAS
jgi:hypothetical protein